MSLIAYNFYDQKLWEVQQNGQKIGFVHVTPQGCWFKTKSKIEKFATFIDAQKKYKFKINAKIAKLKKSINKQSYNFPTPCKPFNEVWDIQRNIPLFTKTQKSKSHYCAGYYVVTLNGSAETIFCPKKIVIERNKFMGPFQTKNAANSML